MKCSHITDWGLPIGKWDSKRSGYQFWLLVTDSVILDETAFSLVSYPKNKSNNMCLFLQDWANYMKSFFTSPNKVSKFIHCGFGCQRSWICLFHFISLCSFPSRNMVPENGKLMISSNILSRLKTWIDSILLIVEKINIKTLWKLLKYIFIFYKYKYIYIFIFINIVWKKSKITKGYSVKSLLPIPVSWFSPYQHLPIPVSRLPT